MNTIVTENTEDGEIVVDIFSRLLDSRIVFISGEIDDNMAADISATLLLKDTEDSESKITIFINSGGGDIRNIFAIYDMITMLKSPIETVCIGSAMKEAVLLLAAGTPGMRYATKHSVICFGQLTNSFMHYSDLTDAKTLLDYSASDNKKMMDIIAKLTNKPAKQVSGDFDRLIFMDSQQAKKYGFIDKVITCKKNETNKVKKEGAK